MTPETTPDESALFDDISQLAASLWNKSRGIEGLSTDPKMFSIMLFKRLWGNHRGYILLWNNGHQLEADIVLRSGVETAICLAANYTLREQFVRLLHQDAAFTVNGQAKLHREAGDIDVAREAEETAKAMASALPDNVKPAKLDWKWLAATGGVPHLYSWHRMLSGLSSHVTGASILDGVEWGDGENSQREIRQLERKMHLMMMAGATISGSLRHAGMLDDIDEARAVNDLLSRFNLVSKEWLPSE